jgi:molybdopterin synthase sulfur carrier subunit
MPVLWIPPDLRDLTEGQGVIRVPGKTVGQALANLETIHPGVWDRLCDGKNLNPNITVVVEGEVSGMGLYEPLQEDSEVHFLPTMEGG